jgi:hypothetical protein
MNMRNVEALAKLLTEWWGDDADIPPEYAAHRSAELEGEYQIKAMAAFLASRGVLVPSAMMDAEQVAAVMAAWTSWEGVPAVRMGVLPEQLERVAKGEPA